MAVDVDRLTQHIAELTKIPRPAESAELEVARSYAMEQMESFGWTVRPHPFDTEDEAGRSLSGVNLIAEHNHHACSDRPRFCVGAHIDSRPDTPGADDNASAVAALFEIARLLPEQWPTDSPLDLELVLFDLEENGMLGGAEHARISKADNVDLRGMVSLEMLGYCDHSPNSQSLPRQLRGLYPDTGDFIAIIGNQNSGALIESYAVGMKQIDGLPVESLQVPDNGNMLQATRLSDHSPFWDAGYSAVMITDTSFMRNPHYHMPTDTLETLDMEFLELATRGSLKAVIEILTTGL